MVTVMVNGTTGAGGAINRIASINGVAARGSSVRGQGGDLTTDIALGSRAHGVYVLTLSGGNGANSSREFLYQAGRRRAAMVYINFFASKLRASDTTFCREALGFCISRSSRARFRSAPVASSGRKEETWLTMS